MNHALPNRFFDRRETAWVWATFLLLAVLAWVRTIAQARAMGNGSATIGMALGVFLLMWTVMMAAMMFPAVAPVAILWSRGIILSAPAPARAWRIALLITGYLIAWSGIGVIAYGVFDAFGYASSAFQIPRITSAPAFSWSPEFFSSPG